MVFWHKTFWNSNSHEKESHFNNIKIFFELKTMQKENQIQRAITQKPYYYIAPKRRKRTRTIIQGNVYIVEFEIIY